MLEATEIDAKRGRYVNDSLGEYLVAVNADVPQVDVIMVPEEDHEVNPLGVKGIGELGIVGTAAAVANAVHHATGKRVRDLPIVMDKLLNLRGQPIRLVSVEPYGGRCPRALFRDARWCPNPSCRIALVGETSSPMSLSAAVECGAGSSEER